MFTCSSHKARHFRLGKLSPNHLGELPKAGFVSSSTAASRSRENAHEKKKTETELRAQFSLALANDANGGYSKV